MSEKVNYILITFNGKEMVIPYKWYCYTRIEIKGIRNVTHAMRKTTPEANAILYHSIEQVKKLAGFFRSDLEPERYLALQKENLHKIREVPMTGKDVDDWILNQNPLHLIQALKTWYDRDELKWVKKYMLLALIKILDK